MSVRDDESSIQHTCCLPAANFLICCSKGEYLWEGVMKNKSDPFSADEVSFKDEKAAQGVAQRL